MKKIYYSYFIALVFTIFSATASAQKAPVKPPKTAQTTAQPSPELRQKTDRLKSSIEAALSGSDVTQGKVGILAVDTATGQVLYERSADLSMSPASNTKLITVAAALDEFGPAHTFQTQILADGLDANGELAGGALKSPLYIKGGGNAFLLYEDFLGWANRLRLKGVRKIDGGIVVDNTLFAGEDLPPLFDTKNEDAAYRAPIGALSVNFNGVTVLVDPGKKAGDAPTYRFVPANKHIQVVNRATTSNGRRRNITVTSETIPPTADTEIGTRIVLSGSIGLDARTFQSRRKRIDNPAQFAGAVFVEALNAVGIEVADTKIKTGKTPGSAKVMVNHASQPLSYIALATNKWSNNFMSEMLLRLLGTTRDRPATWAASEAAVFDFLKKSGIDTTDLIVKNGSGLYDGNRTSPRQFVALLRFMDTHRWAPEFRASLPISGVDGTLQRRLEDASVRGKIRAKTGTLNESAALSGYLRTATNREIAFSIIFNDPPTFAWRYRPTQDRLAKAIEAFDD